MIVTIIGFTVLTLSWILPHFIKDKQTGSFVGAVLAALACGLFVGELLTKLT